MKPAGRDGRIDAGLFVAAVLAALVTIVISDNEKIATMVGFLTFITLSSAYTLAAMLIRAPKLRLRDLLAGLISLLPWR
jgi:hypothetical protein